MHGSTYVDLQNVAAKWGMNFVWLQDGKEVLLSSEWTRLQFERHQRYCTLNGHRIYLGNPIVYHKKSLYISDKDYASALKPILLPHTFPDPPKLYRIVIDPGHGGKDPGAENRSLDVNEKVTVLSVAKKLRAKLEALGYKVILTRETDKFVSLSERTRIANRYKADLFVSLHFNAVDSERVRGVETFVFTLPGQPSSHRSRLVASDQKVYAGNANNTWSTLAGYYVQASMVKNMAAEDRGVKRARFAVLRDLKCPGILVEGGFVTHPEEGRLIRTEAYQERMAESILKGIFAYQKTLNRIRNRDVAQTK